LRYFRSRVFAIVALSSLLLGITAVRTSNVSASSFPNATCSGGAIAPGDYGTLTITGVCSIPAGAVTVHSNLVINPNATLFAASPTASVIVKGSVSVLRNGTLFFGCGFDAGCSPPFPNDTVAGNVVASLALGVVLSGATVSASVVFNGGGGGVNCNFYPSFGGPAFSDVEDSTVAGNIIVTLMRSCWFGIFRDVVAGSVLVSNNTFADSDATEIQTNIIAVNLVCFANSPAAQMGDSGGSPNIVGGTKSGQCANL
jgi:hypothetical protein